MEECGHDAHAREIEGVHEGAPTCNGHEVLLGCGATSDEAEGLHRSAREDGRGCGWVVVEGVQVRHICRH